MANNSITRTDLESLLHGEFDILDTATSHLATDSEGNHHFLILAKATGKGHAAAASHFTEKERNMGQRLIHSLETNDVLEVCPPGSNKQRCGGGWNPGGSGITTHHHKTTRRTLKLKKTVVPHEIANNGVTGENDSETLKELRLITEMARLLRAGLAKNGAATAANEA